MKRHLVFCLLIMVSVFLLTCSVVFAGPVVIKGNETEESGETSAAEDDGQKNVQYDRSKQDGSLIYGMTPVYPGDFSDGTYSVDAISGSQFFRITDAELTSEDGHMTAVITISSTSYAYVYPGTAAEAASAGKSEWIPADETTGYGRFTLDVPALNKEMPCAAFSKKKQKWYDRDIVFLASSLPEDALHIELDEDGGTIVDTQEAAIKVIYIALAIIVAGGILNHFVKKKYYE